MEGDGSDVPSAGQAGEAETDVPQKDGTSSSLQRPLFREIREDVG